MSALHTYTSPRSLTASMLDIVSSIGIVPSATFVHRLMSTADTMPSTTTPKTITQ